MFIQLMEGGCRIDVASQSRVGTADFGQNPRNIRELTSWLREHLEVRE
jgi:uncharacterized protein (DUF1499 family)